MCLGLSLMPYKRLVFSAWFPLCFSPDRVFLLSSNKFGAVGGLEKNKSAATTKSYGLFLYTTKLNTVFVVQPRELKERQSKKCVIVSICTVNCVRLAKIPPKNISLLGCTTQPRRGSKCGHVEFAPDVVRRHVVHPNLFESYRGLWTHFSTFDYICWSFSVIEYEVITLFCVPFCR